ncbi:MAG: hypothetical protein VYE22_16975, partial [Myxococcota bacterium]|nr:hypothetical protein [Myxococcota bacterium]
APAPAPAAEPAPPAARQPDPAPPRSAPAPASGELHALPTRAEIQTAMDRVRPEIEQCGADARGYVARVRFTFVSSGRPTHAVVSGVSGQTASCIARVARGVRVPPFANDRMSVEFPFTL